MEGIAATILQTATNAWQYYITPAAQGIASAIQQLHISAHLHSAASSVLAFAATPLGMGAIGAVALTALIGAVLLIRRRTGKQTPRIVIEHFHIPENKSVAARFNSIMEGRMGAVPQSSNTLVATQTDMRPTLVLRAEELRQVQARFTPTQIQDLSAIFTHELKVPRLIILEAGVQTPQDPSAGALVPIQLRHSEEVVNTFVVKQMVALGKQLLKARADASAKPDLSSKATMSPKTPTRTPSKKRFRGTPLKLDSPGTILTGQAAFEAYQKKHTGTRRIKAAFLSRLKGYDTVKDCLVALK